MKETSRTFHIIGAGIAGLSCARIIKQKYKNTKTIVYEGGDAPGGRCFSYKDIDLGKDLDNATHVIIGANKEMSKYVGVDEWEKEIWFWNATNDELSKKLKPVMGLLLKSATNTKEELIARPIIQKILQKTFPWTRNKRKVYFSKHDLSKKIINSMAAYADEIHYKCRLLKIETQFGRAAQLNFNNKSVELGADDRVILALDNHAYSKLMNEKELSHNSIINIFYRTSQKIHLPNAVNMIGIINGIADWVFVDDDILGITISAINSEFVSLPELAKNVWQELDKLRGVNSAFVPPYKVYKHKYATIAQDELTNSLRPMDASTKYPNVFIAGDWTMKDLPCCMETAVLSAKRAVRWAIKN